MINAVLFDLDGTLRHNLPSGGEFFADSIIQFGLHLTNEDRLRGSRWENFYWANSLGLARRSSKRTPARTGISGVIMPSDN